VIAQNFHERVKTFMAVGGMPSVLETFLSTKSFTEVFIKQLEIIESYRDDISKYCTKTMKIKVRQIFDSIPDQLSKKGAKFKYSNIEKGGNSSKFATSID
jgi:hypothetical protein